MMAPIELTDIKLAYLSIDAAKKMTGLRLILGAYPIPGPWREACKGIFHVKGIPYTPVATSNSGISDLQIGMDGTQSELIEWTGQSSAPVAVWNDEHPRSSWIDQLNLAERLQPDPALVPAPIEDRIRMFGLSNEILGENGLVWMKRLLMIDGPLKTLPGDAAECRFWRFLGDKYGYTEERAVGAAARIAGIVSAVDEQLKRQHEHGSRYLVGDRLSAVDIYWATACGILSPLPPDLCPMATAFRGVYGNADPGIAAALSPELIAHRDFIYEEYLELPIVF